MRGQRADARVRVDDERPCPKGNRLYYHTPYGQSTSRPTLAGWSTWATCAVYDQRHREVLVFGDASACNLMGGAMKISGSRKVGPEVSEVRTKTPTR
jgi:hypothetical protein